VETAALVMTTGTLYTAGNGANPEWTFEYGTGNPGFIKDIKVTNLRDARDSIATTSAIATGTATTYLQPTFYMKKESDGQWSDLVTTTTFDFYLPGYVQYLPTNTATGTVAYHSENLNQYLATTATAALSNAITTTVTSAAEVTVSSLDDVYTMGFTPLDFPTSSTAATAWNTYKWASKLTLSAGVHADSVLFDTDGDTDGTVPSALLAAADTELLRTKLKLNFEYVSMCSNRGSCDTDSGLCKCYAGYTNDNCDTQTSIV